MIVIGTETVERYFATHQGARRIRAARSQYEVWLAIARRARWRNPEDVKASHPRASILKGGRVVFNIKGNDYRLVAALQYPAASWRSDSSAAMPNTTASTRRPCDGSDHNRDR